MSDRSAPPWWFLLCLPLLAFALVFTAFSPALDAEFLEWGDVQGIAQNQELRQEGLAGLVWRLTTTCLGNYQPLSWWSLSLDIAGAPEGLLGPEQAARCHRTNLLLHTLAAIAFGLLAERLLRAVLAGSSAGIENVQDGGGIPGTALFATLLFALHPLRVEAVAWVSGRDEVLSALALILCLYAYVLWVESRAAGGRRGFLVASLGLFLVSLLANASVVVLPALLVVIDFYPLRRRAFSWRALAELTLEKAPYWVLSVAFVVVAVWARSSHPDAMAGLGEHTFWERTLQACYGLWFYIWKSIVPNGLLPLVELPQDLSLGQARFLFPAIAVPAGFALLWLLRKRIPDALAAALAGLILVAPALGFAQAGPQLVADRFSYLPGLAFALLVAGALLRWSRAMRWIPALLATLLLAGLVFATRAQTAIWHDTQTLWSHVLAREPEHAIARLSLGNELARQAFRSNDNQAALRLLREAEQLFLAGLQTSADPRFATRLALLHDALATLEPERAEEHQRLASDFSDQAVKLAIATGRVKPELRLEHAIHLLSLDRIDEALPELEWYVQERPDDPRGQRALEEARSRRKR